MSTSPELEHRILNVAEYTAAKESRLLRRPEMIVVGAAYKAYLVSKPRRQQPGIRPVIYPFEVEKYAEESLIRVDEISTRAIKTFSRPHHPDNVYDFDVTVTKVDASENELADPNNIIMSKDGLMFDKGAKANHPLFYMIKCHAELGFMPLSGDVVVLS